MSVTVRPFGFTREGEKVHAFTITNETGASCTLLDYGATVQALCVPNRDGGLTDVVLGYDTVAEYENANYFLGATIGRFANRLGGAKFQLGGKEYVLAKNDGDNCLHGGVKGFDRCMWRAEFDAESCAVRFSRLSPDGEEGFPGNLNVSVTFRLTRIGCGLGIGYEAEGDADTIVNLTNHSYFDLSGCGKAMEQTLWINADRYLELGAGTVPNGKAEMVVCTPFNFTVPKPVGRDIDADDEQLRLGGGYDHNFCLNNGFSAAELSSDVTGIRMYVSTSMPGMQFYSGNFLDEHPGKGGRMIHRRGAVCLETQLWPDAMNHWGFPSAILRKGEKLVSGTSYIFSVDKEG